MIYHQEKFIRSQQSVKSVALVAHSYQVVGNQVARSGKQLKKTLKKRIIRYGLVSLNMLILIGVVLFVFKNPNSSTAVNQSVTNDRARTADVTNPLDELSSADIAVQVARLARLPETTSVKNNADSQNELLSVVATGTQTVTKPQIVSTALKSKKDIKTYFVKSGDTVTSLAAAFGVTSDSIKWSNGLTGDALQADKKLYIPPVTGIAYEVKAGDTVDTLADKYRASKEQIIADNDVEVAALKPGERILIRDGLVAPVVSYAVSYTGFAWGGANAIYTSNGYDYGYCTYYVANKRSAIGRPLPTNLGNASTWKSRAIAAGMAIGSVPQAGAAAWKYPRDYYGHVAYVESVNADGSFLISEMNVAGWNRISTQVVPASGAGSYQFIY